jgi:hypothetical protein
MRTLFPLLAATALVFGLGCSDDDDSSSKGLDAGADGSASTPRDEDSGTAGGPTTLQDSGTGGASATQDGGGVMPAEPDASLLDAGSELPVADASTGLEDAGPGEPEFDAGLLLDGGLSRAWLDFDDEALRVESRDEALGVRGRVDVYRALFEADGSTLCLQTDLADAEFNDVTVRFDLNRALGGELMAYDAEARGVVGIFLRVTGDTPLPVFRVVVAENTPPALCSISAGVSGDVVVLFDDLRVNCAQGGGTPGLLDRTNLFELTLRVEPTDHDAIPPSFFFEDIALLVE